MTISSKLPDVKSSIFAVMSALASEHGAITADDHGAPSGDDPAVNILP